MNFVNSISIDYPIDENSYLNDIDCVNWLKENRLSFDSPITILVGENGSGKSTIIEAIAIAMGFNPEGGSRNSNFKTKDTHSDLYKHLTIVRSRSLKIGYFLRAESFYNTLTSIDEAYEVPDEFSNHNRSHGESFLETANSWFKPNGLYILDEPEAALSPSRLMSLICLIHEAELNNSQFIIATHSPILMSYPNACIYELSNNGINKIDYKDTEHYQVTKNFIDNPELMYHHLFND